MSHLQVIVPIVSPLVLDSIFETPGRNDRCPCDSGVQALSLAHRRDRVAGGRAEDSAGRRRLRVLADASADRRRVRPATMNIDRIRKLVRLAADPAAAGHEARAAASAASRLLDSAAPVEETHEKPREETVRRVHVTNVAFYVLTMQRRGRKLVRAAHVPDGLMDLFFT